MNKRKFKRLAMKSLEEEETNLKNMKKIILRAIRKARKEEE